VATTLQYESGLLALSLEDVWSGPTGEGYEDDQHIRWRIEGTEGTARGSIGWPTGKPSTLSFASRHGTQGKWITPAWETMWFPDAFIGVMEQLQYALRTQSPPGLSVADNVRTARSILRKFCATATDQIAFATPHPPLQNTRRQK
jgi:predicted dehydrogenase